MNLRFAGMITGCMLVGASAAAYHRADSRSAPSGATLAAATAELPSAPTSAAWPPVTSVSFYAEMFEQLPAATAPAPAAETETPPAAAPRVVRVVPLPRAPQTLAAPNATAGAGIPQTQQTGGTNAGNGGQQTPPPARGAQRPVRTANVTTGGTQTPPAGNTNVAAGGTQAPPAVDPVAATGGQPTPRRAGVTPPRENADMVEVVIRDRLGRPIRVKRVDRRHLAGGRAYPPPPPHRLHHSYPQGPHGGHGGYGPYGLYR